MGRGSCPDVSGMQQLSWGPVEEHGVCTSSLGPAVSRKAHFITSSHPSEPCSLQRELESCFMTPVSRVFFFFLPLAKKYILRFIRFSTALPLVTQIFAPSKGNLFRTSSLTRGWKMWRPVLWGNVGTKRFTSAQRPAVL